MGTAKRAAIVFAALFAAACNRSPERVGANNENELRTPRTVSGNEVVVPGCCSLSSSGIDLQRQPSDSYLLTGRRGQADLSIAFGPFESLDLPGASLVKRIGNVELKGLTRSDRKGAVTKTWVASVPPSKMGEDLRLRSYVLRIDAHCPTQPECAPADQLVSTLRF